MASLNKVLLMGNLTRTPEVRYTPNGIAVCDFGLAMNRVYTVNEEKKEEVTFVDVTVWGKQAESVGQYLQKGSPCFVEGRLQLDQWEDAQTGQKRSRLKVVADRVQFLGSKSDGDAPQGNTPPAPPTPNPAPQPPPQPAPQNPAPQQAPQNIPQSQVGAGDTIPF